MTRKKASPEKLAVHEEYVGNLYKYFKQHEKDLIAEHGSYAAALDQESYWVAHRSWRQAWNTCPECQSQRTSVHNHDSMWGDGDVVCDDCGTFVRFFDSG